MIVARNLKNIGAIEGKKRAGGEGGIRTPGGVSPTPVFKTGAINHSATSPTNYSLRERLGLNEVTQTVLVFQAFGRGYLQH